MKKPKRELTADQERLAQDIFKTVYKWGKAGIKVNHKAPYYEELMWKLIDTKGADMKPSRVTGWVHVSQILTGYRAPYGRQKTDKRGS